MLRGEARGGAGRGGGTGAGSKQGAGQQNCQHGPGKAAAELLAGDEHSTASNPHPAGARCPHGEQDIPRRSNVANT